MFHQYPSHSQYSDQNLIALEDHDSFTPIITAAARSKVKAFQCLMNYQQRFTDNPLFRALKPKENPMEYQQHFKDNPVFKALGSKETPLAILKVQKFWI